MLNSLASYFWGSTADNELGQEEQLPHPEHHPCTNHPQHDDKTEQLETHHEDDWVLIGAGSEVTSVGVHEEVENIESPEQSLVIEQPASEPSHPSAVSHVLQPRNITLQAAVNPNLRSSQELVKSTHAAQRIQHGKAQKGISQTKCQRQNKVKECPGRSSNRRNKLMRPSGFRAARVTHRF